MKPTIALIVLALAACATQAPPPPPVPPRPPPVPAASRDSSQSPDQIRTVQSRLAREGLYAGPVDGTWGPATADALSRWQTKQGLLATGKLDQPTLDALAVPPPSKP